MQLKLRTIVTTNTNTNEGKQYEQRNERIRSSAVLLQLNPDPSFNELTSVTAVVVSMRLGEDK